MTHIRTVQEAEAMLAALTRGHEERVVPSKLTLPICLFLHEGTRKVETKEELKSKFRTWFCSGKRFKHIYMLRGRCARKQQTENITEGRKLMV